MADPSADTVARLIAEAVPAIAQRSVQVPVKRFATVTAYDPAGHVAQLVVDGDTTVSSITNGTGRVLWPGQRVVVDFYPPHGALVTSSARAEQAVRLYRTAAFALTVSGTDPTLIPYDTIDFEYGAGGADITTGRVTCLADGLYRCFARTAIADPVSTERFIGEFFLDGNEHSRGTDVTASSTARVTLIGAAIIQATAGQVLDWRVHQVNGTSRSINTGSVQGYLCVERAT